MGEKIKHRWFGLSLIGRIGLLLACGLLLLSVCWVLYASGREAFARWRFSRDVQRITREATEWQTRAQASEGRAAALDDRIRQLTVQLQDATARAEAAEMALQKAQTITVRVRDDYDKTRNRPLSAVGSVDERGLCAKLRAVGYDCKY